MRSSVLAVVLCIGSSGAVLADFPDNEAIVSPPHTISFETNEGTRMNVDVSPANDQIVFDLLGDIYSLPRWGGDAKVLLQGPAWDEGPIFSKDGRAIYFVSDRVGYRNIWKLELETGDLTQVTFLEQDIIGGLSWSQSDESLVAGIRSKLAERTVPTVRLHSVDVTTGSVSLIIPGDLEPKASGERRSPVYTRVHSGSRGRDGVVYFAEPPELFKGRSFYLSRIWRANPGDGTRTPLTADPGNFDDLNPVLSPDGRFIVYFRQYPNRLQEMRRIDLGSGEDRVVTTFRDNRDNPYIVNTKPLPAYSLTPDNVGVVFWNDGKINYVEIDSGDRQHIPFRAEVNIDVAPRAIPRVADLGSRRYATTIRWPSFSRDKSTLAFSAFGRIWVRCQESGEVSRLTDSEDFEFMPSVSPDGEYVAFISFRSLESGEEAGRLVLSPVRGGGPRELLAEAGSNFINPTWSPDGSKVAVVRQSSTDRFAVPEFGWTSLEHGTFQPAFVPEHYSRFGSWFINRQSLAFDESGERLFISYPKRDQEVELVLTDLAGERREPLARGIEGVIGISPSPDLKHLVLMDKGHSLSVLPFSRDPTGEPVVVGRTTVSGRKIDALGGLFINWVNEEEFSFSFGSRVSVFDADGDESFSNSVAVSYDPIDGSKPIALSGARLITLDDESEFGVVVEKGTIVVDEGRILSIGPDEAVEIPDDAMLIDVEGKTIVPGFIDSHYHTYGGGSTFSANALPTGGIEDLSAIGYGLTTAWDPGARPSDGQSSIRDLQAAGRIRGARLLHSLTGGVGRPYYQLTDYESALLAVRRYKRLGVTTLKEYNTPTRQQRRWLVSAAIEEGLGVVSHLDDFQNTITRLVDGSTGGDHAVLPTPLYRDVKHLLGNSDFIWTPDMRNMSEGMVGTAREKENHFWRAALMRFPRVRGKLLRLTGSMPAFVEPAEKYSDLLVSEMGTMIAELSNHGARIGASGHHKPAVGVHQKLWYLSKGGMAPLDALRTATVTNAEKLGVDEEIGSLEAGKLADFLILGANPLDDVINTLSIQYTIQGGVIYDADNAERVTPEQLYNQLAAEAAANDAAVLGKTGTAD